jgi:hypothetical protein
MTPPDSATPWTAEFYEEAGGRSPVEDWMDDLDDVKFAAVEQAVKHVLERRGQDLAGSEWLKPLGKSIYEFRIRHTAEEIQRMFSQLDENVPKGAGAGEILLRIFVAFHGNKICLLLAGYDKKADPSEKRQNREITVARKRLTEWKERERREKKAVKRQ